MTETIDKDGRGVRVSGQLICRSERQAMVVRRYLPDHLRLTKAEPGCLAFDVSPTDDPLIWTVTEHFRDKDAFHTHQKRTRASAWGTATIGIRRKYDIEGPN